jgi:hypothetical protein
MTDVRPGDVMFAPVDGPVSELIVKGQFLVAPWKHRLTWRTWWRVQHAALVTQAVDPAASTPARISQAQPSGYEEVDLTEQHWSPDHVYLRPKWLYEGEAEVAAQHAREMARRRVPYSFVDYLAIALHRFHVPSPRIDQWVARMDEDGYPRRSICSQGVDHQLTMAGGLVVGADGVGHVFDDGRASSDVVPSELYLRLMELPGTLIIKPGVFQVRSSGDLGELPQSLL